MNDERNSKMLPPPLHQVAQREREISGVEPFVRLRYRRRGRSISRVVLIDRVTRGDGVAHALELFFALG